MYPFFSIAIIWKTYYNYVGTKCSSFFTHRQFYFLILRESLFKRLIRVGIYGPNYGGHQYTNNTG